MKFHVQTTGIAHRFSFCIPAPEGGSCSVTVGTRQTQTSCRRHSLLGFDERPAEAVHFGVEPAGVAEIVAGAVPSPQGGLDGATVDTFSTLRQIVQQICRERQG